MTTSANRVQQDTHRNYLWRTVMKRWRIFWFEWAQRADNTLQLTSTKLWIAQQVRFYVAWTTMFILLCPASDDCVLNNNKKKKTSARVAAGRTLSSLFCQLSSRLTISSMQWDRVERMPAVVALKVMASPLKSMPFMDLGLAGENTGREKKKRRF